MDGLGDLLGRLGPFAGLTVVVLIAFVAWLRVRRPNNLKVELDVTVRFEGDEHGEIDPAKRDDHL